MKPWSVGQMERRITRPLRHTGELYTGINVFLLWSESFPAPIYATLIEVEGQEGLQLIWSRPTGNRD